MFDKVQRDRFWLVLGALLVGLFVMERESGFFSSASQQSSPQPVTAQYDRGGMDRLVEKSINIPTTYEAPRTRPLPRPQPDRVSAVTAANDEIITGSYRAAPSPLPRPAQMQGGMVHTASLAPPVDTRAQFYAQLGAYTGIDRASRRYFDVLSREPDLRGNERVSIDTARVGGEEWHRVRMGPFGSAASARAACARAAIPAGECAIIPAN